MTEDVRKLTQRLVRLEREVKELRNTLSQQPKPDNRRWWQRISGQFEGDAAFAEIVKLGRKIRREDREGKG
jgi:hypothetical protein